MYKMAQPTLAKLAKLAKFAKLAKLAKLDLREYLFLPHLPNSTPTSHNFNATFAVWRIRVLPKIAEILASICICKICVQVAIASLDGVMLG
jgi:hypothetical protein